MLPPGDIRNCLVALAEVEPLMAELFQFRFPGEGQLAGHSFGNLFLAALTHVTGNFLHAIRISGKVLAVRGTILPSTLDAVRLGAELADGTPRPRRVEPQAAGRAHPARLPRAGRREGAAGGVRGDRARPRGGPGAGLALHEPDPEPPGRRGRRRAARGGGAQDLRGEPDDGARARPTGCRSGITWTRCTRTAGRGVIDGIVVHGRPFPPDVVARYARAGASPAHDRSGAGARPRGLAHRGGSGEPHASWRGIIPRSSAASSRGSSGTAAPRGGP